ncbi:hypothetical protein ACQ4PT_012588 [Festuca glaucescens]
MVRPMTYKVKLSWPEVVGWTLLQAMGKIHTDRPDVAFELHYVGENVPPGFHDKRVRLFLNRDPQGTVALTPVVG